jgi:hypothetical protein
MRSLVLTWIIFVGYGPFLNDSHLTSPRNEYHTCLKKSAKNIFDFTVHRLSGQRVIISWHTQGESDPVRFEVLRKHSNTVPFNSLGEVFPKLKEDNSADYSFVDVNSFSDSSFYCLKKTSSDGVIFFSITKGVEGIGKER